MLLVGKCARLHAQHGEFPMRYVKVFDITKDEHFQIEMSDERAANLHPQYMVSIEPWPDLEIRPWAGQPAAAAA